jgi:hypothetical protein
MRTGGGHNIRIQDRQSMLLSHHQNANLPPAAIRVEANEDFTLTVGFSTGEKCTLDMKPYLDFGLFRMLRDPRTSVRHESPSTQSLGMAGSIGTLTSSIATARARQSRKKAGALIITSPNSREWTRDAERPPLLPRWSVGASAEHLLGLTINAFALY